MALTPLPWPCKLGKRRWFHNCIVSPTTPAECTRDAAALGSEMFSTSKAAAVELSTPPLIATAIVIGIESLIH
jgi:predicted metalloenzyme YecM